jgi:hypothetical protein
VSQEQKGAGSDSGLLFPAGILAVAAGVLWHFKNKILMAEILRIKGIEMGWLSRLPLSNSKLMADTADNLSKYSVHALEKVPGGWSSVRTMAAYVGNEIRIPAALLLLGSAAWIGSRGIGRFSRSFIRQKVKADASVAGILGRMSLGLLGPTRSKSLGEMFGRLGLGWKVSPEFDIPAFLRETSLTFPQVLPLIDGPPEGGDARDEIAFAIDAGILRTKEGKKPDPAKPDGTALFDRTVAGEVFSAQLGQPFRADRAPLHVLGIVAVCFARCAGGAGKDDSDRLIEGLARFYGSKNQKKDDAIYDRVRKTLDKFGKLREPGAALGAHAFVNTSVPAVFEVAKKYGQLTTADFVWLKPKERTLWYAMNQIGRKVSWAEAAGCRAHMDMENQERKPIFEPNVDRAIRSLERALVRSGFLSPGEKSA